MDGQFKFVHKYLKLIDERLRFFDILLVLLVFLEISFIRKHKSDKLTVEHQFHSKLTKIDLFKHKICKYHNITRL